jgi:hypothetical protein
MPTEPHIPTLAEVARRAGEIVDPGGENGDVERFVVAFEDRDEPISAIEDLPGETNAMLERGAEPPTPEVVLAAAVTTYLGFRRDEVGDADEIEILRLAVRSEFQGRPPDDVAAWLREAGVEV